MTNYKMITAAILIFSTMLLVGCGQSNATTKVEMNTDMSTSDEVSDDYINTAAIEADLRAELDQLEVQWNDVVSGSQEVASEVKSDVRNSLNQIKLQLDQMATVTGNAWNDAKADISADLEVLSQKINASIDVN